MFTLKFYADGNARMRIVEAQSITVLRGADGAEITMHRHDGDFRMDISSAEAPNDGPPAYDRVIIENSSGKTTEIIYSDASFYKAVRAAA